MPSLTYQSWHEARFGADAWRELNLIPTENWNDYLMWFRRIVGIEVQNENALTAIHPDEECLRAEVGSASGEPWLDAEVRDNRAVGRTPKGEFTADFLISGTGVDMDCGLRPELASIADKIATWADRYDPPPHEREDRLGRYPYLGTDYAFQERVPGTAPFLKDIHCFGIGAWMSFGMSGASINAMYVAMLKLAAGVTRGLFAAELDNHWNGL